MFYQTIQTVSKLDIRMLDNYRKCLLLIKNNLNDLQNVCKCSENSENQTIIEKLKINLNFCLRINDNNQESNDVKSELQDEVPEDIDINEEFESYSEEEYNPMNDNYEELEMNGKSSSKTSKDCHNITITEIQLTNERNADIGVSLEAQHSSKEGSKDESFDKPFVKNKKSKKVYENENQICMYCQKSLQKVGKKDKSKGEEGWYHKKCLSIDYNLKNRKERKIFERCLFCQKSICISGQQLENKERGQSYHKTCLIEFKRLIDSIQLKKTSNGCEGEVKQELGTENIEFYQMNENSLNSTPVSDEGMESNEAVEQITHNKSSERNKFEERNAQRVRNILWLKKNNRFDCLGAEGTDYNSDESNECNDSNELNSSFDLESNNKCEEELRSESKNVSSNWIKFGKSIYVCPQDGCGQHFTSRYDVVRHIGIVHKNDSILLKTYDYTHVCAHEGCGKRFDTPCHLIDHIRTVHTFERPFKCDECNKSFGTPKYLLTHKKVTHPKELFTCDWPECGRVYKQKNVFDDHKRRHLGVREFQCKYEGCAKRFFRKQTLDKHHNTHSKKYECSWPGCNDRFTLKKSLTSHLNRHQNIKPFKCTFSGCGKDFFGESQLMHHNWSFHRDQYESKGGWAV